MKKIDPNKNSSKNSQDSQDSQDSQEGVTRREFIKYSTGIFGAMALGSWDNGFFSHLPMYRSYPIDDSCVQTTADRMLSFKYPLDPDDELYKFDVNHPGDYGDYKFGHKLPIVLRTDIMSPDYKVSYKKQKKLLSFFSFSDIHITDIEAPNQLMQLQQLEGFSQASTSIYSPIMPYTTHVLDAAIQTVNAIHKERPFDFGISLGDVCNSASLKELRWYIDVIDGQYIHPRPGDAHDPYDFEYQIPYKAAGLHKDIPWYQVIGNHDHFFFGIYPLETYSESYTCHKIWTVNKDPFDPDPCNYPALFNLSDITSGTTSQLFYMGIIGRLEGQTKPPEWESQIVGAGKKTEYYPTTNTPQPKVRPDKERKSVNRCGWMHEFTKTTTCPVGHGFNLVDKKGRFFEDGFACYSFIPKSNIPLKVIVLDDTQSELDGSKDSHGHGYLSKNRWAWLKDELCEGQANNQLMIIAAHIPICVDRSTGGLNWMEERLDPKYQNAVDLQFLVKKLREYPNLLMWIAGHRHFNTIKAIYSDKPDEPERAFWQVETSSLRDFPQQFRMFDIYLNGDDTISIVTTNVDFAESAESESNCPTPSEKSRICAIAAQQLMKTNLRENNANPVSVAIPGCTDKQVDTRTDPSRLGDSGDDVGIDPSIETSWDNEVLGVDYHASCNAELLLTLSKEMKDVMRNIRKYNKL